MPADQFKRKVEEIAAGKQGLIPGEILLIDCDDRVWMVRSPSDGLYGFDLRQHRWIEHKDLLAGKPPENQQDEGMVPEIGGDAYQSSSGLLFFGDRMGVHVFDGKTWHFQELYQRKSGEVRPSDVVRPDHRRNSTRSWTYAISARIRKAGFTPGRFARGNGEPREGFGFTSTETGRRSMSRRNWARLCPATPTRSGSCETTSEGQAEATFRSSKAAGGSRATRPKGCSCPIGPSRTSRGLPPGPTARYFCSCRRSIKVRSSRRNAGAWPCGPRTGR